jgi:DedD protein
MENSLKQRIVGAVVLIALAIIFLPSILKEKTNPAPFQTKIPAKPIESMETNLPEEIVLKNKQTQLALDNLEEKIKRKTKETTTEKTLVTKVTTAKQEASSDVARVKKVAEDAQPVSKETNTAKISESTQAVPQTIGKQFKDAAWVIQIASLTSKENAIALVNKLKGEGHKAYRRNAKNKQGKSIVRVFVGPYIIKTRAQEALPKINKISSLSGIVLPFDPINH